MRRILVPLDGSPRAEQILVQVARLLRREDAQVVLLGVIRDGEKSAASAYLEATSEALSRQGVRVRPLLREGTPAEEIIRAALDERAELIALSTHGRSGVSRWLFGSVAEKVVRGAPVPVLLMRAFEKGPQGVPLPSGPKEIPFRRVLVPIDGSDLSFQALPLAADVAKLFGAEIDVLCVEEPPLPPLGVELPPVSRHSSPGAETRAAVEKAVNELRTRGVESMPHALPCVGDPGALILSTAEANRSDLIVLATHGRGGLSRFLLGSVTERILRHSTLPLLIVRAKA